MTERDERRLRRLAWLLILSGWGLLIGGWARGDDFTDRVKALEAKTAARQSQDKHDPAGGDPFAPANATTPRYRVYHMMFRTTDFWVVSDKDYPLASDSAHFATREEAQAEADRLNGAKSGNYTKRYLIADRGWAVCDCGCIETGKCLCPNCCSPTKTRLADEKQAVAPTTKAADDGGPDWTWDTARGFWYRDRPDLSLPVRSTYYQPYYESPVYYQAPAFFRGGFGGNCFGSS